VLGGVEGLWRRWFSVGQRRREDDGVGRDERGEFFRDFGLAAARVKSNGLKPII